MVILPTAPPDRGQVYSHLSNTGSGVAVSIGGPVAAASAAASSFVQMSSDVSLAAGTAEEVGELSALVSGLEELDGSDGFAPSFLPAVSGPSDPPRHERPEEHDEGDHHEPSTVDPE